MRIMKSFFLLSCLVSLVSVGNAASDVKIELTYPAGRT